MNKLIISMLIFVSTYSFAVQKEDTCPEIANIAKTVMTARQNGESMRLMMSANKKGWDFYDITSSIIIDSFESASRYNTKKIQLMKIADFENKWYLRCYKSTH